MKRLSRTRLFLLEMLVNLLVFCIGAAWYSQDWQPVREKKAIYRLVIRARALENHVIQAKIEVYPPQGEPVAALTVCEYTGPALREDA